MSFYPCFPTIASPIMTSPIMASPITTSPITTSNIILSHYDIQYLILDLIGRHKKDMILLFYCLRYMVHIVPFFLFLGPCKKYVTPKIAIFRPPCHTLSRKSMKNNLSLAMILSNILLHFHHKQVL